MLVLDSYFNQIETFLLSSVNKFKVENGHPSSISIYCCPWAGWMTANFNINKSIEDTNSNCPDFEFVEFDALDLEKWQEEYESEKPTYKILLTVTNHNHDFGDEKLNEFFFDFLKPIAYSVKQKTRINVLLQLLDSNCRKTF